MPRRLASAVLAASLAWPWPAGAKEQADGPPGSGEQGDAARDTEGRPGPLPAAAAVVPGVIVHGAGSFAAGRRRTAAKLLVAEGVGVGLVLLGGATLALTGANRHLAGPAAVITIGGVGLFATSFAADIYAATSRRDGPRGAPPRAPVVVSELGLRHVVDPQFPYRWFAYEALSVRHRAWRVEPSGWFSLGPVNQRLRVEVAHRLHGARPDRTAPDASLLDVEIAGTHHHFGADAIRAATAELTVQGRLDLVRFDPALRGSFAELSVGAARRVVDLGLPAGPGDTHAEDLLLTRFAWGVLLGPASAPSGEVSAAYDHRHDDYAAGLLVPGLGSGVAGHFELSGEWWLDDAWGVRALGQVGAAVVTGVSIAFREGGER